MCSTARQLAIVIGLAACVFTLSACNPPRFDESLLEDMDMPAEIDIPPDVIEEMGACSSDATCPERPNATAACDAGACVYTCQSGWTTSPASTTAACDCEISTGLCDPPRCGDGRVDDGEQCDDGDNPTTTCDYGEQSCMRCNNQCQRIPGLVVGYCGDGVVQSAFNETCDGPIGVQGALCLDQDLTYGPPLRCSPEDCTIDYTGCFSIEAMSLGRAHSCALTNEGKVYCWGDNSSGQLGDGTTINRATPTLIKNIEDATSISTQWNHTCALKSDSTVWCWGENIYGQIGDGTTDNTTVPTLVKNLNNVANISTGHVHTCARLLDKTIRCWGSNDVGELGIGQTTQRIFSEPQPLSLIGTKSLDSGKTHNCVITNTNTVLCWGENALGEIGNSPDGEWRVAHQPSPALNLTDVKQISLGLEGSHALKTNGQVYSWGDVAGTNPENINHVSTPKSVIGPSPSETWLSNIDKIASGSSHICAVNTTGTILCWGSNSFGQCGNGTTQGDNLHPFVRNRPSPVMNLGSVSDIAGGGSHTCAKTTDGQIYCWGANNAGQLGDGTTTQRLTPTPVLF